jgi:hypothetical protein
LLEFESIADASEWTAPDPIEIRSDTDFRAELADAAYQALLRLDRRRALGERLKSFIELLSGFKVGASSEGGLEFSFDPSAVAGSTGNLERDLTHVFVELGETARGLMVDAKSYAERLFSYPELRPLSNDAARHALVERPPLRGSVTRRML